MTAVSDETGREPLQSPQHIIEGIILRRLHDKRIEGYTLEMSEEIVAALSAAPVEIETGPVTEREYATSAAPVAQEPYAFVHDHGNEIVRTHLLKTMLPDAAAKYTKPLYEAPPATPAGVGADEIARALKEALVASLDAQGTPIISGFNSATTAILALLSRAGDQK